MPDSVLTLGTFDGVHLGHQRIIRKVVARARARGAESTALAFGMPPRMSRKPLLRPILLTTLDEKLQHLRQLGLTRIQILVFDRATASTLPEDFFRKVLLGRNHAREIIVGPRLAFGKNRAGKLPLLKRLGRRHHVRVHVIPPVRIKGKAVSSRQIRASLYRGDVETAGKQLGYPYSVSGKVIHGSRRGHSLGYPTANLDVDHLKILPRGVFWVKVLPGNKLPLNPQALKSGINGLCNVGTRPTFTPHAKALHCEVYLFKKTASLYGKTLRIVFLKRIRAEKRFNNSQALQRQIGRDFAQAQRWSRARLRG